MIVRVFAAGVLLLVPATTVFAAEPPSAGLLVWLDAADASTVHTDGGRVTRWDSKAPGGKRFGAEGKQRPQYVPRVDSGARPGVLFDGLNDVLRELDFGQRTKSWTLAIVATPYGRSGEGGAFVSAAPTDGKRL